MNISFDRYKDGKTKAITMSYDDGVEQDKRLISIFDKYGIKGTFNLNGGLLNGNGNWNCNGIQVNRIRKEDIKKVYEGHEIASHSLTHPWIKNLPKEEIVYQLLEDKKILEDTCDKIVRGFAYPFGSFNDNVINTLKSLGYDYARAVSTTGNFTMPDNFYIWEATCHHNDNLLDKSKEFLSFDWGKHLGLMYVWGHSYEFDLNNNWNTIEEFCRIVGNNDDIWYATNIEIYDYLKALKMIKFSIDRKIVYNPSGITLWFSADEKVIEIKPNEYIRLN